MNSYEEEEQYLLFTIEKIKQETEKLKTELQQLIDTGKSLSFEDKKRGEHFNVNSKANNVSKRIDQLSKSVSIPYFGRMDIALNPELKDFKEFYIGRSGISSNGTTLVTDWRAPISNLYYDSQVGQAEYESPNGKINVNLSLKKQITIKNGKLLDVQNSELVTKDELLQPYLNVNADSKMKTIIASIQKEQNDIIRNGINENIIVQGVAGSGKTSVALHKIAYLIYNLGEKIKSNQILIIGPNQYFLNYISSILPELETDPVSQETYMNLVKERLNENISLDIQDDFLIEIKDSMVIKKIKAYKSSLEYKEIINLFLNDCLKSGIVLKGFEIDGEEIFSSELIRNKLFNELNSRPNFDRACNYFVNYFKDNIEIIYERANKKYRDIYMKLPPNDSKRSESIAKSGELRHLIKDKGVKLLRDYFKKLKLKTIDIYKDFIIHINNYSCSLSEKEILQFQKYTLTRLEKKKICFEDLPALLHINNILYEAKEEYKHIVIDEAQDYGLFHFDALTETFPGCTFSIYGDLAQSIYSYRSVKNWESVVSGIFNGNCNILNLNKSYRTTMEITENANNILSYMNLSTAEPVIRHGISPKYNEFSKNYKYKMEKILEFINKGYKTIALICKTDRESEGLFKKINSDGIPVTRITEKETEYNGGIVVLTSALSKGLEFDAVIINDASSGIYDSESTIDMHLLYVACTRALHELDILYEGDITKPFQKVLYKKTV